MTKIQDIISSINTVILKYHHLARGVLIILLGMLIGITAYYAEQHVILFGCLGFMTFAIYEGAIHILSNPVKADIALDVAKAQLWAESEIGFDPTGVTKPPQPAIVAKQA